MASEQALGAHGRWVAEMLAAGERVPTGLLRMLRAGDWMNICRVLRGRGYQLRHEATDAVPLPADVLWWTEGRVPEWEGEAQR